LKLVADGIWQLSSFPPHTINAYLVEDVLVDAQTRHDGKRILKQLRGHTVTAHALTHAHPDHQGSSRQVCDVLGVPFWVGEGDADAAESPDLIRQRQPDHPLTKLMFRLAAGPGRPVDRVLREGDEVAGFQTLHTPGHSAGHMAFWRERDHVLILGDVLNSMDPFTSIRGLREPKRFFTPDPATNRRSAGRLAELEPSLVLFGHGPPLRDTKQFVDFCRSLSE
jgi:hydroxyacylglutathione hydrolase